MPESAALACPAYPFQCSYWRIDIVANAIWHALFDEVAGELEDIGLEIAEISIHRVVVDRITNGWNTMLRSHKDGSHGT